MPSGSAFIALDAIAFDHAVEVASTFDFVAP